MNLRNKISLLIVLVLTFPITLSVWMVSEKTLSQLLNEIIEDNQK